jgi:hypothetical protein
MLVIVLQGIGNYNNPSTGFTTTAGRVVLQNADLNLLAAVLRRHCGEHRKDLSTWRGYSSITSFKICTKCGALPLAESSAAFLSACLRSLYSNFATGFID